MSESRTNEQMAADPAPERDLEAMRDTAQGANEERAMDVPGTPTPCEHYWAWVSPAGTRGSARLCQFCHQPDPNWLNEIVAQGDIVDRVELLTETPTVIVGSSSIHLVYDEIRKLVRPAS